LENKNNKNLYMNEYEKGKYESIKRANNSIQRMKDDWNKYVKIHFYYEPQNTHESDADFNTSMEEVTFVLN